VKMTERDQRMEGTRRNLTQRSTMMIKVTSLTGKNEECDKEFQQGVQWADKGSFIEIQDSDGKPIASFQSGKILYIEKKEK